MGFKETFQERKNRTQEWLQEKTWYLLLRDTFKEVGEDKVSRLSAALAYYALFSLAPLLIIAVLVAGVVFGEAAAEGTLMNSLDDVMGDDTAALIQDMVAASYAERTGGGILATAFGILLLLFAASRLFGELRNSMNEVWEVEDVRTGIKDTIRDKSAAFLLVILVGVLLLALIVATTALSTLGPAVVGSLPGGVVLWQVLNLLVSLAVVTALFAVVYRYLPDTKVSWKDVSIGAAATSALFVVGKFLLGLYFGRSAIDSTYGAAGTVVVLILWLYYSAFIFFVGAEFTQVYSNMLGSRVKADKGARPQPGEEPSEPHTPSEPGRGTRGGEGRGEGRRGPRGA